jgi:FkbH-like protein
VKVQEANEGIVTARSLTLCGTFTVDPLADVLEFWGECLGVDLQAQVAPYGQLFQQLLDPSSLFHSNVGGANAVLLRWADLMPGLVGTADDNAVREGVQRCIDDVAAALTAMPLGAPCLVIIGPDEPTAPALAGATEALRARVAGVRNLHVVCGDAAMQCYRVTRVADPASDRFGHVPFTSEAMTALGTTIARWYTALHRPPVKMLAVDCDNTLWSGVVAEDGIDGLTIGAAHARFQRTLASQCDAGRLVCLLSKNEASDVRRVFEQRMDMALAWTHVVDHRVDWNPKPENLRAMATALGIGLDSIVFLDDSPLECAGMRAASPAVTTVQVPTDPPRLESFIDHLWLLDHLDATSEDRDRIRMYRDHAHREQLLRGSDSLQAFLDGLELSVEVGELASADMARMAQLSQRTNQFNASLVRCHEIDIRRSAEAHDLFNRVVRARDRFGDYGTVGAIRARRAGNCLEADLFLLSCRALGRGIEHRMVAALGEHALAAGLEEVAILFRAGERNAPARRFLQRTFNAPDGADEGWFRLPAWQAAELSFDATMLDSAHYGTPTLPADAGNPTIAPDADGGVRYEYIAHALTTAARIEQAIARRTRGRPDLATSFARPEPGVEQAIAAIWQEVLRIDAVGRDDRFQDLGGKSLQLVQVHRLLLDRLGADISITTMFQHPTVASLATCVQSHGAPVPTELAHQRGIAMRNARSRAARNTRLPA